MTDTVPGGPTCECRDRHPPSAAGPETAGAGLLRPGDGRRRLDRHPAARRHPAAAGRSTIPLKRLRITGLGGKLPYMTFMASALQ